MIERRDEILQMYKEHKITSAQAIRKIKELDRRARDLRRGKKTGGKQK